MPPRVLAFGPKPCGGNNTPHQILYFVTGISYIPSSCVKGNPAHCSSIVQERKTSEQGKIQSSSYRELICPFSSPRRLSRIHLYRLKNNPGHSKSEIIVVSFLCVFCFKCT